MVGEVARLPYGLHTMRGRRPPAGWSHLTLATLLAGDPPSPPAPAPASSSARLADIARKRRPMEPPPRPPSSALPPPPRPAPPPAVGPPAAKLLFWRGMEDVDVDVRVSGRVSEEELAVSAAEERPRGRLSGAVGHWGEASAAEERPRGRLSER